MKDEDLTAGGRHRELFDEAVDGLDAATANRLRLMRRATLARRSPPRARLVPVAAFATGLLALGLGWQLRGIDAPTTTGAAPPEAELALDLASEEEAALYAWLGEAPVAAGNETL